MQLRAFDLNCADCVPIPRVSMTQRCSGSWPSENSDVNKNKLGMMFM